jgi:hypothetical protein
MPEHVRMWPCDPHPGCCGEPAQPPGGGVPVHPRAVAVEQDRPGVPAVHGAVDGPAGRWGKRDQDHLAALAGNPEHSMAVLLAEVTDAGAGGLEDPKAQQPGHGHQGEIVPAGGLAGGGEQGLELQVGEPERW